MRFPTLSARLASACALALAAPLLVSSAFAQTAPWPSRPVKLIVPFPPGGPTDLVGREAARVLREGLGGDAVVVVENRAGGNGTVGLEVLAKSAPDGYTLGLTAITLAIAPHLGNAPFDAFKDYTYISNLVSMSPLLVANPATPANNLAELVSYAKANPGKLSYGTPGVATIPHLSAELLSKAAGIKMMHIPYKGATQQIQDLIAGVTPLDFQSSLVVALPHIKAGKLKAIAVLTPQRSPLLPDVPTAVEGGYKDVAISPWFGFGGPAGLSPDIVRRANAALVKGMNTKETIERFNGIGATVHTDSPEHFAQYVRDEYKRWGEVIKSTGVKAE
jgi:tripartite-type tricarboxylate transporter receptor subunit TctC